MKTYVFKRRSVATVASRVGLVLFSLFPAYVVIAQFTSGAREVQYEVLWMYVVVAYWWYGELKPVKRIELSAAGEIAFVTALGRTVLDVRAVQTIRPLFNLSVHNSVLRHARGSELLFGDPTAVSLIAAEIRKVHPGVHLHHVPELPL